MAADKESDVINEKENVGNESDTQENEIISEIESIAEERVKESSESDVDPDEEDEKNTPSDTPEGDENSGEQDSGEGSSGDEKPAVDDALLERAIRAGISMADAREMSSRDGMLERFIDRFEADHEKSSASKDDGDSKDDKDKDEDLLAKIPDLDPDEHPEEIVDAFKGIKDVVAQQQELIKSLRSGQIDSANADAEEFVSWFDGRVKSLGKEYEDTLGTGQYSDLSDEGRQARAIVARRMDVLAEDLESTGKVVPARDELFGLAVKSAFTEKTNEIKGREVARKSKERSRKAINVPRETTGKFASESSTNEDRTLDAIKEVEALMEDDN